MASVRMTNELRHDIRRKAEEAYQLANPRPKPNNAFIADVRNAVINSPEQKYLRDVKQLGNERAINGSDRAGPNILPITPKDAITGIDLRNKIPPKQHVPRGDYQNTTVKFDTPIAEYLIVSHEHHRWGDPTVWINDLRTEDKTQVFEHFQAYQTAEEEYTTARRNYDNSICDLVNNVTTLKQLLEIWPAAESLIPNDKIQKMHVKVTRAQRAAEIKEEVCFDPTIANQAVLTAKMLGG